VKSESRAVETREVPGQFRGEPPCLTSIVVMRQPSKLMSGVQFPGEAPRAGKLRGRAAAP
jgi:hypothetical protein